MTRLCSVFLAALLAGCGSTPTGKLTVTVSGLPAPQSADVEVTGPAGAVRVAATTELTALSPGTYAVTGSEVAALGVDYRPTVSADTVTVSDGAAASVTVSYAAVPAPGPDVGALTVTIRGLPAGLDAAVTVTGPNGFSAALAASGTLGHLAPGTYTVAVADVRRPGQHVSTIFEGTASAAGATVAAGSATSALVTYAQRPGSGNLWMRGVFSAAAFDDGALAYGASVPTSGLAIGDGSGGIFDHAGNLWYLLNGTLRLFPKASLPDGAPQPTNGIGLGGIVRAAFDASGALWLSTTAPSLVKFSAATLATQNPSTPDVTLTLTSQADALAFDSSGALWAATQTPAVVKFSPAQLAASGSPTPAVTLTSNWFGGMRGLAFDSRGNLFVAATLPQPEVLRVAASALGTSGDPAASFVQVQAGVLAYPAALAFDEAGDLWVTDLNKNLTYRLSAGALYAGYLFSPAVALSTGDQGGLMMAFDPPPANLPLAP